MNSLARRSIFLSLAAIFLIQASPAFARKHKKDPSGDPATDGSSQNVGNTVIQQLTAAHNLLGDADRDYDGHRFRAMSAIRDAGKALGATIHSRTKAHENQTTSDDRLKSALEILKSLQQSPDIKSDTAHQHINHAIDEINTALNIR